MKKTNHLEGLNCPCSLMLAAGLAVTLLPAAAQGPAWSVMDRGAFYRVWQATVSSTDGLTGQVSEQVASYTELGDGLNHWKDGQWVDSQDLIEIAPTGAAAVHGQMTASFSGDITGIGAITLTSPSGLVFQSHPIGLYYADPVSGKVAQIGSAQPTAGVLYPPNIIVFTNVLSGLNADLMLIWTKGGFEQNLVIKEAPPAPESFGLSNAACRLQFWTAMDCPAPEEQRPVLLGSGLVDHILMYPDCWFPVGCAFAFGSAPLPAPGEAAAIRLYSPSKTNAIPTAKSLVSIAGQQVLIEEINYADLLPAFSGLSQASLSPGNRGAVELAARGQLLSAPGSAKPQGHPIQVASAPYSARGAVLDYVQLSGTTNSYTFTSGTTYCISNSFYIGSGTAAFQAGACVKSASGAWLIAYGPVSFPASGANVVFTSVNDNSYGTVISNSTSEASYAASQALWMYYQTTGSTVQNALFRWAQTGIEYDENGGVVNSPALSSSVFQNCNIGAYVNMPSDTLYLSNDTNCNVVTPISIHSDVKGSMTANCGTATVVTLVDSSHTHGFEGEPSITVNPANPSNLFVVAMHTTDGANWPSLFTARSTDGGLSWTTNALGHTNYLNDTSAAFDAFGNLFVCYWFWNTNAGFNIVVDLSTDGGNSFNTITNFSHPGYPSASMDQPTVTTGPSGSPGTSSVWITFQDEYYGEIVASGATVTGLGHVGAWTPLQAIGNSVGFNWGGIAVGPTGQVAVVFQDAAIDGLTDTDIRMSVNPSGVGGTFPSAWRVLTSNMGHAPTIPASPRWGINIKPGLAWDRTGGLYRGRLYMVYTDRPVAATNNLNIFVTYSTNAGASWSPQVQVHATNTLSHFHPRIAVDQTSGKVAVSWYDCRADPNNTNTQFYATVSSDGGQTFSLSLQLESGHSDAPATSPDYGYEYLDYTGLAYYGGYFYPAWADNSDNPSGNPDATGEMDIFVAKVQY